MAASGSSSIWKTGEAVPRDVRTGLDCRRYHHKTDAMVPLREIEFILCVQGDPDQSCEMQSAARFFCEAPRTVDLPPKASPTSMLLLS
jgi:hypothetical protein